MDNKIILDVETKEYIEKTELIVFQNIVGASDALNSDAVDEESLIINALIGVNLSISALHMTALRILGALTEVDGK